MTFIPKFADLVRNAASVEGTGPVTLGEPVPGYLDLAETLSAGDQFYYCLSNVESPNEREVGRGAMLAGGQVERLAIDGSLTDFGPGTKTIALVTAAEWFQRVEGATAPASADQIRAGSEAARPIAPAPLFAAAAPVTLAYAPVVRPDLGAGINFNLTLTGDVLIEGPVGAKPGQSGRIRLAQDATGGRAARLGAGWQLAGGPLALSSTPLAADVLAYFVNLDGAIEATLAPALDVRPVPLSVSDFQNGLYSLGGEAAALAELWEPRTGEFTAAFLADSIIPGVGWQTLSNQLTLNSLYATAGHQAALPLVQGISAVFDYQVVQPAGSGTKPRIVMTIPNPAYDKAWGFYHNGAGADRYVSVYDYGAINLKASSADTPTGAALVAATLAQDGLAFSSGGAPAMVSPAPQALEGVRWLEISAYTSHTNGFATPSEATLRKLTIYPKLTPAQLAILSGPQS